MKKQPEPVEEEGKDKHKLSVIAAMYRVNLTLFEKLGFSYDKGYQRGMKDALVMAKEDSE